MFVGQADHRTQDDTLVILQCRSPRIGRDKVTTRSTEAIALVLASDTDTNSRRFAA